MKTIDFKGSNQILGRRKSEKERVPIYHYSDNEKEGVVTCWKLNWKERIRILFTGEIYSEMRLFYKERPSQLLSTISPVEEREFRNRNLNEVCSLLDSKLPDNLIVMVKNDTIIIRKGGAEEIKTGDRDKIECIVGTFLPQEVYVEQFEDSVQIILRVL